MELTVSTHENGGGDNNWTDFEHFLYEVFSLILAKIEMVIHSTVEPDTIRSVLYKEVSLIQVLIYLTQCPFQCALILECPH